MPKTQSAIISARFIISLNSQELLSITFIFLSSLSKAAFESSVLGFPHIKITVEITPASARNSAQTKPSPPLFPLPLRITTLSSIFECAKDNISLASASPALPISSSKDTPSLTDACSASAICLGVTILSICHSPFL